MYRSGQFAFRFVPWEVPDGELQDRMRKNATPWDSNKKAADIPGFLSFVMLILSISEAYLFAARLSQAAKYDTAVDVNVGLRGVQGWALGSNEHGARLFSAYIASSDIVESVRSIPIDELIADPLGQAMICYRELVEQFGWLEFTEDVISYWQRKYIRTTS
jgi:hypothetical protein